jgi:hypothetical protein
MLVGQVNCQDTAEMSYCSDLLQQLEEYHAQHPEIEGHSAKQD